MSDTLILGQELWVTWVFPPLLVVQSCRKSNISIVAESVFCNNFKMTSARQHNVHRWQRLRMHVTMMVVVLSK